MKRVAICGAGPMGLTLAYFLRKYFRCVVFESSSIPGGMSASFDFDGVTIEKYYHFINTPDQELFSLLDDLGMKGDLRWQSTKMGLFRKGKDGVARLHPWGNPLALLALSEVSLITRLRYGFHAYACKFLKDLNPLDDVSAADWFSKWEGVSGYDTFWRFLFEKKFFELSNPLSAAWIASRIRRVANSRESLMKETLGYLQGGSLSLIDRLQQKLRANSGILRVNEPVLQIIPEQCGGGKIRTAAGDEYFDVIISTMPLPYLCKIGANLPAKWLNKISQIKNIACACVLFRLSEPLTENFWLNVDMPEWDIPGIIEYSNLRPMDKAYVYIPFYMPQSHRNWALDDNSLCEKARGYLKGVNPHAAATEEAVRVFRYEYAQPVCPPGFRNTLPSYETGAQGILAADTSYSFPEDRSINESIRIARELALSAIRFA